MVALYSLFFGFNCGKKRIAQVSHVPLVFVGPHRLKQWLREVRSAVRRARWECTAHQQGQGHRGLQQRIVLLLALTFFELCVVSDADDPCTFLDFSPLLGCSNVQSWMSPSCLCSFRALPHSRQVLLPCCPPSHGLLYVSSTPTAELSSFVRLFMLPFLQYFLIASYMPGTVLA